MTPWMALLPLVLVACSAPPPAPSDAPSVPTYYGEVAPLLARRCGACHRDAGVAPFALSTYEEAKDAAHEIAKVTRLRTMPPWPADAGGSCGTFVDQRWLSEDEIALLDAWHTAGAPAGDPSAATPIAFPEAPRFTPAVELAADVPYPVVPSTTDDYRCFVADPGLVDDAYITAMQVTPDRAEVVHHIQLFAADSAADEAELDRLVAADASPGYACGNDGVGPDLRYVGVWAAGDLVRRWPDGTGIQLRAGHRLVLQIHYHHHGGAPVLDHTRVALELARSVDKIGLIERARNLALVLPPGESNIEAIGVHRIAIDTPSVMRGARIHMHTLGIRGRLELVRGGESTCLLAIPRWDFNWQLFYLFDKPVPLLPGDELRLTCAYDTRTRTEPVLWGLGTDDEMCIGQTYITD
ncbi:MAG: hypothetical protein SFX73_35975 [Kofleriaceae bacterium]|nr:hypothetical protein [Kofleriaceae bacterium]